MIDLHAARGRRQYNEELPGRRKFKNALQN
jgi:hypothetical protein